MNELPPPQVVEQGPVGRICHEYDSSSSFSFLEFKFMSSASSSSSSLNQETESGNSTMLPWFDPCAPLVLTSEAAMGEEVFAMCCKSFESLVLLAKSLSVWELLMTSVSRHEEPSPPQTPQTSSSTEDPSFMSQPTRCQRNANDLKI